MVFILLLLTLFLIFFISFKNKDDEMVLPKVTFIIILIQSVILSFSSGYWFWENLGKFPQKYFEPTFGQSAYNFENKDSDFIAIYFSIIVFFISFLFLKKINIFLAKNQNLLENSNYFSLLSLIPFFIFLGQTIKVENLKYLLFLSLFFAILDNLIKFFALKFLENKKIKEDEIFNFFSNLYLIVLFSIFSGFGLSIFFGRVNLLFLKNFIIIFFFLLIFAFFIFLKYLIYRLNTILFLSQLLLPFLLSIFLSPVIRLKNGITTYLSYKPTLYLILILFAGVTYFDLFSRFIKKKEKILSPFSLILILFFLLSEPAYLPYVFTDDFHGGHYFLPWFLLKEKSLFPFLDFQPAYGLLNYLPGFFSSLFYDGSYSGLVAIGNLFSSFFILITFFSLRAWILDLPSFLITFSAYFYYRNNQTLLPLGFSIFLILLKFKTDKIYTFWLWFFSSLLIVFYNIPDGVPFVLGMSPFVFYSLYHNFKKSKKILFISFLVFFVLFVFLFLFTDFEKIILNELKYFFDNAKVNVQAQGIKWDYPQGKERVTLGPLWQFVRFGWLFIFIPFLFLIYFKRKELKSNPKLFILAISLSLICTFEIPRALGRIDKIELSRPYVPNALIIFGIPLIFYPLLKNIKRVYFLGIFSIFLGIFGNQEISLRFSEKILKQKYIVKPESTISGKDLGIYCVGEDVIMDKNQILRQKRIKDVLDKIISKEETYYDCTNHIADYFFQNKKPPTRNATIYDISSIRQQREILKDLKKNKPLLALIFSENYLFDGGPLPFRAPLVYFYLMENFIPFEDEYGYVWMIKKGEEKRLDGIYKIRDLKDQIKLLNKPFFLKDLKGLPASWGASIS